MRPAAVAAALSLLALGLAGCVSGDAPDAAQEQVDVKKAKFDEETGALEGLVLDGEGLPVLGARVGIQELQLVTTTDAQGRFALSHVEPGTHTVFAQALGYESIGQRVDVPPGQATRVQLELAALAVTEPYSTQVIQDGLFGCGASWSPPLGVPGVLTVSGISACGVLSLFLNLTAYDKFLLDWEVTRDVDAWNGSVFEMSWESNQVAGRGLTMLWEVCSNDDETTFADAEGESPLRVHATSDVVHGVIHNGTNNEDACDDAEENCHEEECIFISRVFSTPQTTGGAVDVGVTIQQRFTQYHTAFFYEPGSQGYTAIVDG